MPDPPAPPPRYTRAALPPYRYRPGRDPHPTRDPRGHAYGGTPGGEGGTPGGEAPERPAGKAAGPASSEAFLYAVDLFNGGYYWECHEALEELWAAAGRREPEAAPLQGLIQLAAALLKHEVGETAGARRLAARGAQRLRAGPAHALGLDGPALAARVQAHLEGAGGPPPQIRLAGVVPVEGAPG